MAHDLAAAVLLAGAVACLVLGLRARRGLAARVPLALALAVAAAAQLLDDPGPADAVAAALAAAGLIGLVRERFGTVPVLSWLDALMGATASGALVAVAGGATAAVVAVGGAVGAMALSRWQPSPSMIPATAGVLVLGGGDDVFVLAAPLLVAAAWRRDPRVGPGPQFRWTVLAVMITCAIAALALLGVGQFTNISDVAGALAIVTVVAGTARAGITVTDRLRESEHRARTDDLTGLGNRRHLIERLDEAIGDGEPLALLLIDLDGFKELNDTLGHPAGDQVLRQIGPRLASAIREHDTMARLGGDEFALVIAPGDEAAGSAASLRVRSALERSFEVSGIAVHIDASVGIALFPDHSSSALGLLQRADIAMYEAKRARTGYEVYLPARDRHSRERLALVGELHAAIDSGQLVLHYQPKAQVPSGAVLGVEALVRWHHPERGMLGPSEFLPLVEQSGLTRALTAFVIDRALADVAETRSEGLELEVAVNLGPADLLDLGLPTEVERLLHARGVPAEALKLEVSEDLVMAAPERTLDVLGRLRDLGVGLSLDDFGAGQSSLSHLRQLDLDELKIDRSFLLGLTDTLEDAAIVRTTVELGHRLGLRVVAEGVASREAWELLAACQCDEAQGFYVAQALPLDELRAWMAARAGAQRPS